MTNSTLVYRVRRLPRHVDRLEVKEILGKALDGISTEDVHIYSLATAVDPWERSPTRTATVAFSRVPTLLREGPGLKKWDIKVLGLDLPLILDSHFYGFTALNDVVESQHKFE